MQKTITIELPETMLQPLVGLIDAAVRATGLRGAAEAAQIVALIQAAAEKAQAEAMKPRIVANGEAA